MNKHTIELYRDKRKDWRWRLRHVNGRIIAESGEGYRRRGQCVRMVGRVAQILWVKPRILAVS